MATSGVENLRRLLADSTPGLRKARADGRDEDWFLRAADIDLIVLLVNAADEIAALIEAAQAVSDCEDLQNDKITPAVDEALSRQDEALAAVERKLAQP